jgi:hypothetical protein
MLIFSYVAKLLTLVSQEGLSKFMGMCESNIQNNNASECKHN